MSRITRSLAFMGLAGFLTVSACDAGFIAPLMEVPVDGAFSLLPEGVTVEVGETVTVTASLYRPNNQPINPRALSWSSTDPTVAAVDRDGVVLGRGSGHTEIIATSGNLADTTDLVVVGPGEDKSGITVAPEALSLDWIGATTDLKVHVYDGTGTLVANPDVSWGSLEPDIAPVDDMGKVTARGAGLALIVATATCCDRADTAYAEIRQVVTTVAMSTASLSLEAGQTRQLSATPKDQGGTEVGGAAVEWSSSNASVAEVSSTGLVTAKGDGSATITARSGDISGSVSMQVGDAVAPPPARTGGVAELPRHTVDTSWPGYDRVVDVPAGASIQAAIDNAQPGDFIRLAPGAVYHEHLVLRAHAGGAPILIGSLPEPGRAVPGTLPKIVGTKYERVISIPSGVSEYRMVGVEVQYEGIDRTSSVIAVDHADRIVFDRVVVGGDYMELQRAIQLNGTNLAVIDSWLMAGYKGSDAQAVAIWSGAGPYHLEGNYLAGSGENVMVGGATAISLPSDITIRRNYFHKPEAWRDGRFTVKNLFEMKFGARVLLEANIMDGNWADGQDGDSWNIKLSAKGAGDRIEDITARYNILRNARSGPSIQDPVTRMVVEHNLFLVDYRLFTILGSTDLHLINNTGRHASNIITATCCNHGFVATGNIWGSTGGYGVKGSTGEGQATLDADFPGWVYRDNGHIGRKYTQLYPAGNLFQSNEADVLFNADWSLGAGSPFAGIGADIALILERTAGVD